MEKLISGARALGIELTLAQLDRFEQYYRLLVEWNRWMNLTRILDYEQAQLRHFLDSLSAVLGLEDRAVPPGTTVIDVGTGAGFPGLPLKIAFPGMKLWLNDSVGKKAIFLNEVVRVLGLAGVEVVVGRAEELGRSPQYRERFDLALCRAVADLAVLAELCLPLCRVGGRFVAHKKGEVAAEVKGAQAAIRLMGGAPPRLVPVRLEGLGDDRLLVVIDKLKPTPAGYPRRPGMAERRLVRG